MKTTYLRIAIVALVIVVLGVLLQYAFAPSLPTEMANDSIATQPDQVNSASSSGSNINGNTERLENRQGMSAQVAQDITSATERKQQVRFQCEDRKEIEGIRYAGGQNPRIEFTLTDYSTMEKGVENETRTFILNQIPVAQGIKYANADRSIVLTGKADSAILSENGVSVLQNCMYVTSSTLE